MDNVQLLQAISEMMDRKLEPINHRLDVIEGRLDALELQVAGLTVAQEKTRKELQEVHMKVTKAYKFALDAWGRSQENRVWLENSKLKL